MEQFGDAGRDRSIVRQFSQRSVTCLLKGRETVPGPLSNRHKHELPSTTNERGNEMANIKNRTVAALLLLIATPGSVWAIEQKEIEPDPVPVMDWLRTLLDLFL